MKNLFKCSNLVVGSAAIALNLTVSSPQAMAFQLTWNLDNAEFSDNTFATGSFDYDVDNGVNGTYSGLNITTTAEGSFPGRNYNDANSTISGDANSLVLNVGNETLTLNFESPLTNNGGSVPLLNFTQANSSDETITSPSVGNRKFIAGEVSTIPFEFSPSLGIIACLCWVGIPIVKNKLS